MEHTTTTCLAQVLGRLYPHLSTTSPGAAGIKHLRAALKQHADRADLWEMLGDSVAAVEPAEALQAYSKASELLQAEPKQDQAGDSQQLPARLLNNRAVLELRAGNVSAARAGMEAALAAAAAGNLGGLGAEAQVTIGFNLARVREACGELEAAGRDYRELLQQFPRYADPYLRLAAMARRRGDTKVGREDW